MAQNLRFALECRKYEGTPAVETQYCWILRYKSNNYMSIVLITSFVENKEHFKLEVNSKYRTYCSSK